MSYNLKLMSMRNNKVLTFNSAACIPPVRRYIARRTKNGMFSRHKLKTLHSHVFMALVTNLADGIFMYKHKDGVQMGEWDRREVEMLEKRLSGFLSDNLDNSFRVIE